MNNNNEIYILKQIERLPDDIICIIKEYLTNRSKIFLTKVNYIEYHYLLRQCLNQKYIEKYIRYMLTRDLVFVFEQILNENYKKWINIKHYIYKNVIYKNYIYFVKDFCIENESIKCRTLINKFLTEHGLCQNQHKKNVNRNIRWRI
jgi:hypothetical protein